MGKEIGLSRFKMTLSDLMAPSESFLGSQGAPNLPNILKHSQGRRRSECDRMKEINTKGVQKT